MQNQSTGEYRLRPEQTMLPADRAFLDLLPINLPETKLSPSEQKGIRDLYDKHIAGKIEKSWGVELHLIEMQNKWPSGHKMSDVQAKRIVIGWLMQFNDTPVLSAAKAAELFRESLISSREAYQILVAKSYQLVSI